MLEGSNFSGVGGAPRAPGLWVERYGTRMLTATVQEWVKVPKSVRTCGFPIGSSIGVHYSPRRPVIRGLRQCRNRFVCPDCSWYFRLALETRWNAILVELINNWYAPAFVVLPIAQRPGEPLEGVLVDLMDGWQRFRSLDGHKDYRAGTGRYAWALGVTVGDAPGRYQLRLYCFTVVRPPPADPAAEVEYTTDLWCRALLATSGRSVSPSRIVVDYLTPYWLRRNVVSYALGLPYRHLGYQPDYELVENRYRRTDRSGSTLLDLALRAHLGDDTNAGRMLAQAAEGLTGRGSHWESTRWKQTATQIRAPNTDTDSIFTTIRSVEPQPFCTIGSGDYFEHKTAIDHWCDTTIRLFPADMRVSLEALLAGYGIEPIRSD